MDWITPDWPAPSWIKAVSTTRTGGVSRQPFDSMNLGTHVDDDIHDVTVNRARLADVTGMPTAPSWLNQVHGTNVVTLPLCEANQVPDADASFSAVREQVCVVMTADCLPVLFCNKDGTEVAAAHAGWRGLVNGVLEETLAKFSDPKNVMAWLGPAIGAEAFEVGSEVREQFMATDIGADIAFKPHNDRWLADIYLLAKRRLESAGVSEIYGGTHCTVSESDRFYSYRRESRTGRQASCIWMISESDENKFTK